jgi:probable rRNA maturation factor
MVVIQNSINDVLVNEQNLKDTLQQVITDLDKGESELLIRVVGEAEIQDLNKKYRDKDQPTNVLSFPSDLPVEIDELILGDVIICTPVVVSEAIVQNKTFEHHLTHMAIHGTLHLLGFDHIEESDANEMEALEIKILEKIKIANPYE